MWQGRAGDRSPYADCRDVLEIAAPGAANVLTTPLHLNFQQHCYLFCNLLQLQIAN
jgi:hypothetical protein